MVETLLIIRIKKVNNWVTKVLGYPLSYLFLWSQAPICLLQIYTRTCFKNDGVNSFTYTTKYPFLGGYAQCFAHARIHHFLYIAHKIWAMKKKKI